MLQLRAALLDALRAGRSGGVPVGGGNRKAAGGDGSIPLAAASACGTLSDISESSASTSIHTFHICPLTCHEHWDIIEHQMLLLRAVAEGVAASV